MSLPCSSLALIPQKGKMGFDQVLIKAQLDGAKSTALIQANHIFLDDQYQLSNTVLIEYVNQLIAAVHGYYGMYHHKAAERGLFVGLQEVEFLHRVYRGDALTIQGVLTEEVGQVTFIRGTIHRGDEKVAELVTKLYEVKDSSEFDALTNPGDRLQPKSNLSLNNGKPPVYLSSVLHRKLFGYLNSPIITEDCITFEIACPEDFDAFDGHFPGNPLLPGVMMLEIGQFALTLLMHKSVAIKTIQRMKIGGIVLPNQIMTCTVRINGGGEADASYVAVIKGQDGKEISRFNGYFNEGREA